MTEQGTDCTGANGKICKKRLNKSFKNAVFSKHDNTGMRPQTDRLTPLIFNKTDTLLHDFTSDHKRTVIAPAQAMRLLPINNTPKSTGNFAHIYNQNMSRIMILLIFKINAYVYVFVCYGLNRGDIHTQVCSSCYQHPMTS